MKTILRTFTRAKRMFALSLMLTIGVSNFKASAQTLTLPEGWKLMGWVTGADHGCYRLHVVITDANGNYIASGDVWLPVDCNKTIPSKAHIYNNQVVISDDDNDNFYDTVTEPDVYATVEAYLQSLINSTGERKAVENTELTGVDFMVFPNPATNNQFNLKFNFDPSSVSKMSVGIYNYMGQVAGKINIDPSKVSEGTYQVKLAMPLASGLYDIAIFDGSKAIGHRSMIIK